MPLLPVTTYSSLALTYISDQRAAIEAAASILESSATAIAGIMAKENTRS